MRTKYRSDVKKCPRCNTKCLNAQKKCEECGLVFARLSEGTNEEAKKQFWKKDKSIVLVKEFPKDVVRWKLILMCFFLGLFGAHNLWVGRYYRGFFMLVVGLLSLVYVSLPSSEFLISLVSYIFILPALLAIFWVSDFVGLCVGTYKVPIAIKQG